MGAGEEDAPAAPSAMIGKDDTQKPSGVSEEGTMMSATTPTDVDTKTLSTDDRGNSSKIRHDVMGGIDSVERGAATVRRQQQGENQPVNVVPGAYAVTFGDGANDSDIATTAGATASVLPPPPTHAVEDAEAVDETAFEMALQQRMKSRTVIATDVQAEQKKDGNGVGNDDAMSKQNHKLLFIIFGLGVLCLVAAFAAIMPSYMPTTELTVPPNTTATTPPTITDLEYLLEIVSSLSSAESLEDPSSPQSMALNWMAFEDDPRILSQIRNTTDDENARSHEILLLLERYALVVLYYSTGGHDNWVIKHIS